MKPVAFAEGALGPGVDAALFGISGRQVAYREALRDEEEERRQNPQRDRARASRGGGGEPAEADDRHDVEEHQIAQRELARKRDRLIAGGWWLMVMGDRSIADALP